MRFTFIALSIALLLLSSCASRKSTTGYYKVGKPYKIADKIYTPKIQNDYDEVGMASWYGSDFHRKETANGATFNRNSITAAHRTLPLPCMVKVTNLSNNKTLVVMVNDRGPFSKSRILDMSEHAADLLGFRGKGTTKVRVQYLPEQTAKLIADLPGARGKNFAETKPTKPTITAKQNVMASSDNESKQPDIKPEQTKGLLPKTNFIQVGTYKVMSNAKNVGKNLSSLGEVKIISVKTKDKLLYKVKIGPIADKKSAELILKKTIGLGHRDAVMVKEGV